jgi:DNA polymerase-1
MGALQSVRLHLVDNLSALDECRRWAGNSRPCPLFFDTESGGLNPYRDRMRLLQLGDMTDGWAFPVHWAGAAAEILMAYEGPLGAHNHGYDWRVLQQNLPGIRPLWHKTEDSLTLGHLDDSMKLAGLKERAEIEVDPTAARGQADLQAGMRANRWTWGTVPATWAPYWCYGALDPVLAAHLWMTLGPRVLPRYREAYDLERAVIRICAGMMDRGMMVDLPFIREKIADIERFTAQALPWLRENFGIETVNSGPQVMRGLNSAGIQTVVLTEEGNPSISKEALGFYAGAYPEHAALINTIRLCRKAGDLTGKYLGKFLAMQDDGIMHYSIWPCRARTSRMSVTDPPMQTYDRDEPVVRGAYIPRPGHVLAPIDADQFEMRLTAHFSGDAQLIADFLEAERNGQSFFVLASGRIYGEQVSKKDPRYNYTKNSSYAQVYGASLRKAAATAGVPEAQMGEAYYGFQRRYPGVPRLMQRLIYAAKRRGGRPYADIIDGRRLWVPRGHEYAILNTEVQGGQAVLMKRKLVELDAAGFGEFMDLTIHDEILFEFPEKEAERMLAQATELLTDRTSLAVPITWSGTILRERWRKT